MPALGAVPGADEIQVDLDEQTVTVRGDARPEALTRALAESEQARECFAEMWLTYAAGRSPRANDACLMEEMAQSLDAPGGLRAMLVHLFRSPEFLRGQLTPREEVAP